MNWNKSTADNFMKGIFSYVNNESLRDLHLSPSMAFNPHVHSTKFLIDARAILAEGTVGYVALKCSRRWGESLVFPSTATIKELVKEYNIPLEVRSPRRSPRICVRTRRFVFSMLFGRVLRFSMVGDFRDGVAPARCAFCSGVCVAGGWRLLIRSSPRTARCARACACARPRGLVAH